MSIIGKSYFLRNISAKLELTVPQAITIFFY